MPTGNNNKSNNSLEPRDQRLAIDENAFRNCRALDYVVIPQGVKGVSDDAFRERAGTVQACNSSPAFGAVSDRNEKSGKDGETEETINLEEVDHESNHTSVKIYNTFNFPGESTT